MWFLINVQYHSEEENTALELYGRFCCDHLEDVLC